jgi:arylsulfatase
MRRHPWTNTIGALALLVASCSGDDTPAPRPIDLFARTPAEVVRDRGDFEPHPTRGWAQRAVGRWREWTAAATPDHPAYVCALEERAGVRFSSAAPRTRDITVHLALFFDNSLRADGTRPPPRPVRVYLNSVELGVFDVGVSLQPYVVHAPAAAWRAGANVLEFEVEELVTAANGDRLGVAVGPIATNAAHDVVVDTTLRRARLDSGTALTYRVESIGAATLDLEGLAAGHGLLRITQRGLDPLTGAKIDEGLPVDEFDLDATTPLQRQLDLYVPEDGVLEIELAWFSEDEASLALERAVVEPARGMSQSPIVVIAIDTLSAQHLASYGYERETAPNLTAFAQESIVFDDCATNATWTVPSFMALFTGQFPNAHEIEADPNGEHRQLEQWEQRAIAPNRWTLAESLRAAGYQTAGFVDNTWLSTRLGFAQGFDVWDDEAGFVPLEDRSGGIELVGTKALAWLDARQLDRPWFLFLHAFDVHGPYVSAAPHRRMFEPVAARDRQLLSGGVNFAYGIVHEYVARGEHPEGDLPETISSETLRAAYDGGIHEFDAKFGRLLDELRTRELLDEAVVVVLADHGETMAERDFWFGHGVLDRSVTHVPLIVRLPGGRRGGTRVVSPVQLVDVAPTLLDLVGLPHEREYFSGRSLRPALEGWAELEPRPQFTYSGLIPNQRVLRFDRWRLWCSAPRLSEPSVQLTHPRVPRDALAERFPEVARRGMTPAIYDSLLADPGAEALWGFGAEHLPEILLELYDIESDPLERVDLADRHPDLVATLFERVVENRTRVRELRALAQNPRELPSLSDEALENLRRLGYVDPKAQR